MKIEVNNRQLLDAVITVSNAVSKKSAISVLEES
jgi:DNA polymerase III sliding clamp (beta) subunit (PCNA family)